MNTLDTNTKLPLVIDYKLKNPSFTISASDILAYLQTLDDVEYEEYYTTELKLHSNVLAGLINFVTESRKVNNND